MLISVYSYSLSLEKVINAFKFALERHSGQLRKDGSTPYIVHPFRVFLWLADEGKIYDENVLAAAFLHDLIEDTKTDYDDIMNKFRDKILSISRISSSTLLSSIASMICIALSVPRFCVNLPNSIKKGRPTMREWRLLLDLEINLFDAAKNGSSGFAIARIIEVSR